MSHVRENLMKNARYSNPYSVFEASSPQKKRGTVSTQF